MYTNRSIVGAKVESQPFGGEIKSSTGFKAGGPHYLLKFMLEGTTCFNLTAIGGKCGVIKRAIINSKLLVFYNHYGLNCSLLT